MTLDDRNTISTTNTHQENRFFYNFFNLFRKNYQTLIALLVFQIVLSCQKQSRSSCHFSVAWAMIGNRAIEIDPMEAVIKRISLVCRTLHAACAAACRLLCHILDDPNPTNNRLQKPGTHLTNPAQPATPIPFPSFPKIVCSR